MYSNNFPKSKAVNPFTIDVVCCDCKSSQANAKDKDHWVMGVAYTNGQYMMTYRCTTCVERREKLKVYK